MLNIKNLEAKIDNKHILRGLNLDIKPGEVHAIMGPNVSGKSTLANVLSGKTKAKYSPNADLGDFVVVVNADKIIVTGKKSSQKNYYHHTGYPGGLKTKNFEKMLIDSPEKIIENAVKGMLPKNKLSNQVIKKLKIYSGSDHPHSSQKPKELAI